MINKVTINILQRWTTFFNKMRYAGVLSTHGRDRIERRVNIRPFSGMKKTLKVELHHNSHLKHDIVIQRTGTLVLGENSYISSFSVIGVNERIEIGKNVMIVDTVSIRETNHNFEDMSKPMIQQSFSTAPVRILDNVWLGHGAVITKGVTGNTGTIVGANTVVTKDVPENAIVGGVPAKIIRYRDE